MKRTQNTFSSKSKKEQFDSLLKLYQSIMVGDLQTFSAFDLDEIQTFRMTNVILLSAE